jgi:flagellar biosynthetic protein FliP
MSRPRKALALALLVGAVTLFITGCNGTNPVGAPTVDIQVGGTNSPQAVSSALQVLVLLTVLSLAPALLMLVTAFTRIVIVLSFVRHALAMQQIPPNQVVIGLALFLTFFVMAPTWQKVNDQALQPYLKGDIDQQTAYTRGIAPVREFLFRQTRETDLALFIRLSQLPRPATRDDVPTYVLIPAYVTSELKTAFQMGVLIFVPFLIIDMVVASALMSMGMMMLPPSLISLPFKLLLFVMVDGWELVMKSLVASFGGG